MKHERSQWVLIFLGLVGTQCHAVSRLAVRCVTHAENGRRTRPQSGTLKRLLFLWSCQCLLRLNALLLILAPSHCLDLGPFTHHDIKTCKNTADKAALSHKYTYNPNYSCNMHPTGLPCFPCLYTLLWHMTACLDLGPFIHYDIRMYINILEKGTAPQKHTYTILIQSHYLHTPCKAL